jgi:mono/diheme cytochrome c family protein
MRRRIWSWIGIALAGIGSLQAAQQQPPAPASSPASQYRAVLDRYCVTCHNERLKTAGLMLDKMDIVNVPEGAETWEKVVRKLRTEAMPPTGLPRPDKATYNGFATYLETSLDRASAARPNPGRPVVHRLNRAEYVNAVRDLLAIDTNAIDIPSQLPADDSGYGFDNIGDVLSVSPVLLERYLSVAQKLRRLAIGDPTIRPEFKAYSVPTLLMQDDRMNESLPFGSRGGVGIRHHFALDGEYQIKILLQRDPDNFIKGLGEPRQLDVRVDGERIKLFTVGGVHKGPSETAFGTYGDTAQTEYERSADAGLELRFPVKAGTRVVSIGFLNELSMPEGVFRPRQSGLGAAAKYRDYTEGEPALGSVAISGPYDVTGSGDTPSRKRLFVCQPSASEPEEACARKILATLATRAYRRPATEREVQVLFDFYKAGSERGGFDGGIGTALRRVLVSPQFLFRIEPDPDRVAPGSAYPVSDLELASRLSFFLWSSIPDDELLGLAQQGKLREPGVLEQQVRRMIADGRVEALGNNFAGQWLYLRNVKAVAPDPEDFPDFDENLREALQRETELFFSSTVRDDRSLLALLNADYTFLNERLARHYGVPNVYGSHFRRVPLKDENRRGLLGQGSILTVTSYATRTSPTLRGKWVMENILGAPLPPPPADVPSLQDRGSDGKILSVRQLMEQHRANAICASCHSRMDPLGFALDNFDALGQWRDSEAGKPIDDSGVLPDGTKFKGVAELRNLLLSHPDQFAITVTEKLLTYALGRGVEYYDYPAIRKIVREASASDYRWSSIIAGIVKSTPFQMRRSQEP